MLFPKWVNTVPTVLAMGGGGATLMTVALVWYYFTPKFWVMGYMPEQPGAGFSHQIHAGKLGMDCRYCHTHIEESPEANIPHVSVCYGCHAEGRLNPRSYNADRIEFVRTAYQNDEPIAWRRVHKLPDYVRNFPHHVHLQAGVSCYSCHGQIIGMPVVFQAESLSMGWCLECHRAPEDHLVPPDKVTELTWVESELSERRSMSRRERRVHTSDLIAALREAPPENCGACHH
ncbi:MAG: cytochrome C [Phycisphaerales bacterium]|nr:MAG: cytochrome C [Phycisphaerales bacterium]